MRNAYRRITVDYLAYTARLRAAAELWPDDPAAAVRALARHEAKRARKRRNRLRQQYGPTVGAHLTIEEALRDVLIEAFRPLVQAVADAASTLRDRSRL